MRRLLPFILLLCPLTVHATVFTPANSAELTTALATAIGGDEIQLTPLITYTGPFTLRSGLTSTVTIRSTAAIISNDLRVTATEAATMPVIICSNANNQPCFSTSGNDADNWRVTGIKLQQKTGTTQASGIVMIGDPTVSVSANTPDGIEIDHCWIEPAAAGTVRGIFINGRNINIHDNVIIGYRINGQECQAILLGSGPGPVTVRNNHLQAMGEVFMSGGLTTAIFAGDLTFIRNYVEAPQKYNPWNPTAFDTTDAPTTTTLPCQVSSLATTVTCTSHGLPVDSGTLRVIRITSGPQAGEQRTLYGVSNSSTFSIQTPFSNNQNSVSATVSTAWGHKNNFELKMLGGTANLIEANVFDGSWVNAQDGVGLVLTVRTEGGALPTATIKNTTIQYNYFKRFNGFLRVISPDDNGSGVPISAVNLNNNLVEWVDANSGPGTQAGAPTNTVRFILLNGATASTPLGTDLWLNHFTLYSPLTGASYVSFTTGLPAAGDWVGFKLENSLVATQTNFGIFGDGGQSGNTVLATWCANPFSAIDNAFVNQNVTNYPAGSFSEASASAMGFADVATSNFLLTSGLYRAGQSRQASDGTDRGADIAQLSIKLGASSNAYATATLKTITGQWTGSVRLSGKVTLGGKIQ